MRRVMMEDFTIHNRDIVVPERSWYIDLWDIMSPPFKLILIFTAILIVGLALGR